MTGTGTTALGQADDLLAAFAALEEAASPVPEHAFVALVDPVQRKNLAALAREAGRVLVEVPGRGWLTGYDDSIADRLVAEGVGVLTPIDRAVLALVVLHTVVVPRARGQLAGPMWSSAIGTDLNTLARNRSRALSREAIQRSVRRLRASNIVTATPQGGILPGPQMLRLTARRQEDAAAAVLIATKPHGLLARVAEKQQQRRRNDQREGDER